VVVVVVVVVVIQWVFIKVQAQVQIIKPAQSTNATQNSTNTQKQNNKQTKNRMLQEKSNMRVLEQNPYTLNPGKKSLIKTDLQLNMQLCNNKVSVFSMN
jgi:predicted Holliday junction resolvase-like endonuclease